MRGLSLSAAALALATLSAAMIFHTPAEAQKSKDKPSEASTAISKSNNTFGTDLFKQLHEDGENTFISPASIAMCVQMATRASGGDTRDELRKAMHVDDQDLNGANRALLDELAKRDGVKLNIANSIWADPARVTLNKEYADEVIKYFDAEARTADFNDPQTLEEINGWIAMKTEDLITNMLDEIPADAITYLINAIYFKGEWTAKFDKDKTHEADFNLAGGETKTVQMMERKAEMGFTVDDGTQVVKLPYGEDENVAMYVALPAADSSLDALVKDFDGEALARWRKNTYDKKGTLKFPRIKMRYKKMLNAPLQELGIKKAFIEGEADFKRLGVARGPIFIGRVLHEAVVEVNEEGTEAAAATVIEMKARGMPPKPWEMTCDRPFMIVIADEVTGAVLFMGTVYDPGSEE